MWYSRSLYVACLCFLSISFGTKLSASNKRKVPSRKSGLQL